MVKRRLVEFGVLAVCASFIAGVPAHDSSGGPGMESAASSLPLTGTSVSAGLAATSEPRGIRVSWTPVPGATGYTVYRQQAGSTDVVQVNSAAVRDTSLVDAGLRAGVEYTYAVSAQGSQDAVARQVSSTSTSVPTVKAKAGDPLARWRKQLDARCPATTDFRVTNVKELRSALSAVEPGQTIRLAAGTYTGNFTLERSGTATAPIWICGPRTAVLDGGGKDAGTVLRLNHVSNVNLSGFTVQNGMQGVMVKWSDHVSVSDMAVRRMGYEGVHLYAFTTDSVVRGNDISDTGLLDVAYGEGVYIGTSNARWDEVTDGRADTTSRVAVVGNTITRAGAEPVEAKAGTSAGVISDNVITGHQPQSRAIGWVLVTGNDWLVQGNVGSDAVTNGYALMKSGTEWGLGNVVVANRGTADAGGWGVLVHKAGSPVAPGTVVGCDNAVTGARSGLTFVPCQS